MKWWSKYVGKPFVDGGRGPDAFDCWGLCRAAYQDALGVDLPSYGEISARDLVRVARTMSKDCDDGWRMVSKPEEMDIALMRGAAGRGRAIVHVGVMINSRRLLHIEPAAHAAIVPINHFSVRHRIAGYRRLEWL